MCWIDNTCASFYWLAFISPKFTHILNYFVQSCDCMIAAFRNSDWETVTPSLSPGVWCYRGHQITHRQITLSWQNYVSLQEYCCNILSLVKVSEYYGEKNIFFDLLIIVTFIFLHPTHILTFGHKKFLHKGDTEYLDRGG